jgi:ketosteroid isomerase-like protein
MTLSSSDIAAIRASETALAAPLEAAEAAAWVDYCTDDAIFVGPGGHAVEGRSALLEINPAIDMAAVELVAESTDGSGDFAAVLGRGSWARRADGPDAPSVRRCFLMVWPRRRRALADRARDAHRGRVERRPTPAPRSP